MSDITWLCNIVKTCPNPSQLCTLLGLTPQCHHRLRDRKVRQGERVALRLLGVPPEPVRQQERLRQLLLQRLVLGHGRGVVGQAQVQSELSKGSAQVRVPAGEDRAHHSGTTL